MPNKNSQKIPSRFNYNLEKNKIMVSIQDPRRIYNFELFVYLERVYDLFRFRLNSANELWFEFVQKSRNS